MNNQQILEHKTQSLQKWQNILQLATELGHMRLGFHDCGYCVVHTVNDDPRPCCANCQLDSQDLCNRGQGDSYKSIARFRDYSLGVFESQSAQKMIYAIAADIKALQKSTRDDTAKAKSRTKPAKPSKPPEDILFAVTEKEESQ